MSVERRAATGPSTEGLRWIHPHEPRDDDAAEDALVPSHVHGRERRSRPSDWCARFGSVGGERGAGKEPRPDGLRAVNAPLGSVHGAEAQPGSLKLWKSLNIIPDWLAFMNSKNIFTLHYHQPTYLIFFFWLLCEYQNSQRNEFRMRSRSIKWRNCSQNLNNERHSPWGDQTPVCLK